MSGTWHLSFWYCTIINTRLSYSLSIFHVSIAYNLTQLIICIAKYIIILVYKSDAFLLWLFSKCFRKYSWIKLFISPCNTCDTLNLLVFACPNMLRPSACPNYTLKDWGGHKGNDNRWIQQLNKNPSLHEKLSCTKCSFSLYVYTKVCMRRKDNTEAIVFSS